MTTFLNNEKRPRPASNGVDIRALARLARLEVSEAELTKLEKEIPNILKFVETIQAVSAEGFDEPKTVSGKAMVSSPILKNVMRADDNPHAGGLYTETLLKAAPARVGDRIAVKQVISRKK